MELLLLADPSEKAINKYLNDSRCFVAYAEGGIVGVCILKPIGEKSVELMNIAVSPSNQKNGIGAQLIEHIIKQSKEVGARRIEVGTGTFGYPLTFYQKHGFRVAGIDKDFFLNNYSKPIIENGIRHKDMLRLTLELNMNDENHKQG